MLNGMNITEQVKYVHTYVRIGHFGSNMHSPYVI